MLTKEKRKKLLAGTVASIMVAGAMLGGCSNGNEAARLQKTNSVDGKSEDDSKDSSFGNSSGFWPWFFMGRATADSGVHYNSSNSAIVNKRMSEGWRPGSATATTTTGTSASSIQKGTTSSASNNTGTKSTLGKTGTAGKTGIGSGMSRSSAVS